MRKDRGTTFVTEQPPGPADEIIFAAPSRSTAALSDMEPAPAATTAPAPPPPDAKPAAIVGDAAPLPPAVLAEYKRQAREQASKGSIAATRALLQEAVAAGDAEAQYLLARTFDPVALAHDGVIGVAADPSRAADLYRRARAGGYPVPDTEARTARP